MTLSNIVVSLDLGDAAADRVRLAAALAERFGATLTGVAAREILAPMLADDTLAIERIFEEEERLAREQIAQARTLFERAAGAAPRTDWHSALAPPLSILVEGARGADLVVVGRQGPADGDPGLLAVPAGALLMAVGRPVLVAPPGLARLSGKRIVVAWKDTREARRAVHDALPFLTRAERAFVVAVGPDARHEGAEGTAAYLVGHGCEATTHLLPRPTLGPADALLRFAEREGADLIVMGAYGHGRLREWIFGGVTRAMLRTTSICCLMSH